MLNKRTLTLIYTKLLLYLLILEGVSGVCPSTCSCGKWKNGKETSDCSFKDFRFVPEGIPSTTQVFHLIGNNIPILHDFTFKNKSLVHLQRLYMPKCHISDVRPNAFSQLSNLVELDLSENELTVVPGEAFRGTPALRQLKLNGNSISIIDSEAFTYTPSIVSLDISNSEVVKVAPEAFQALSMLETLELQNNKLRELPIQMINGLDAIHDLKVYGNPWACNCQSLLPVWRLLRRLKLGVPKLHSCEYPIKTDMLLSQKIKTEEYGCPPENVLSRRFIESVEGNNTTISCDFWGDPTPLVHWYHDGILTTKPKEDSLNLRSHLSDMRRTDGIKSHLIIRDTYMSDSGTWTCEAINQAGKISSNLTLDVKMRPKMVGGLTPGHIAGIAGGALLIAMIIIILILLCRKTTSRHQSPLHEKHQNNQHSAVVVCASPNPVQKPPRLTELPGSNKTDPDLISHLANGYPINTSMSSSIPGDYTRVEGDSLYPSGMWEEIDKTDSKESPHHEHHNPGFATDSPRRGRPNQSTPLRSNKPLDPKAFGYPSDYGLPIPEIDNGEKVIKPNHQLYDSRQELSLYNSSTDIYSGKDPYFQKLPLPSEILEHSSPMYEMMEMRSPKHELLPPQLNLHDSGHQDTSPSSNDDSFMKGANTTTDGSDSASVLTSTVDHQPWQAGSAAQAGVPLGIPVLPPLPTGTLQRIKPRDSPDEGYQEGTEV